MREIKYTVSLDGVTPSNVQFGGMQGEHNATRLNVTINTELFTKLEGAAYRFEAEDGAGCRQAIAMGEIESENVVCSVPQSVTCNGGNVTIRLIFSKVAETEIEYILYSFPIRLRFDLTSNGKFTESKDASDISAAVALAKGYTEKAEQAANMAENAAKTAVNARNGIEQEIAESLTNAKESGEFDGEDGVSVMHEWNGTELTVTSASGTSSADLKGEKGDKGDSGSDYILTENDKNEIATKANAVSYSEAQKLTDEQKQRARENINAVDASLVKSSLGDVDSLSKNILTVSGTQELVEQNALNPNLPNDYPAFYIRKMREHLEVDGGKWEKLFTIEGDGEMRLWEYTQTPDGTPIKLSAVAITVTQTVAETANVYGQLYGYYNDTYVGLTTISKILTTNVLGGQAVAVIQPNKGYYEAYGVDMAKGNPANMSHSGFRQFMASTADLPYINKIKIVIQNTVKLSVGNKIDVWGVKYYE